jgi:hypothetical protein
VQSQLNRWLCDPAATSVDPGGWVHAHQCSVPEQCLQPLPQPSSAHSLAAGAPLAEHAPEQSGASESAFAFAPPQRAKSWKVPREQRFVDMTPKPYGASRARAATLQVIQRPRRLQAPCSACKVVVLVLLYIL